MISINKGVGIYVTKLTGSEVNMGALVHSDKQTLTDRKILAIEQNTIEFFQIPVITHDHYQCVSVVN